MRISDWSSDVCSSDLVERVRPELHQDGSTVGQRLPERRHGPTVRESDEEGDRRVRRERGATVDRRERHVAQPEVDREHLAGVEIGRASCRERVCQYVWISVVAGSLKKQK